MRAVCRRDRTGELLALLARDSGVLNLAVHQGRAVQPAGDVVEFGLLTASANDVLRQLHEFAAGERSPVTVQSVELSIPEPAPASRATRFWPHLRELPPVWDLVRARIRAGASYAPSFFILLVIAGLIAAVGILINSQILIVAAMVVGPEYGATVSVAAGLQSREWGPVRNGLVALAVGFLLAIAASLVFAWCIRKLGETPDLYERGVRPVSDLINSPNLFSVVVAVLAGIVGVVSLAESRANALIGVFISVTTIPAAADIGVSLAYGHWPEAGGSAVQLVLNIGLLIIVGALALRYVRHVWQTGARGGT